MKEETTIDNGVERDVDAERDFLCHTCSTETLDVWHERPVWQDDNEGTPE